MNHSREWRDFSFTQSSCPHCGHVMWKAGDPNGERAPRPGDFAVCIRCAGVSVFTRRLRLRAPNPAERRSAMLSQAVQRFQAAVRQIPDGIDDR